MPLTTLREEATRCQVHAFQESRMATFRFKYLDLVVIDVKILDLCRNTPSFAEIHV